MFPLFASYLVRKSKPPSQTWRTFLNNHASQLASTDFFVVPTVTFRGLFVFIVLAHHRRQVIHFNVTAHPSSEWTAQQIAEAFSWDSAPRYLLHDRDSIYGGPFRQRVRGMGVREVLTAPGSPWQNPYAERLMRSIRRECLDHIVVFNESSLRRTLKSYFSYYHGGRTHLSLEKDAPETRPIQPPELGSVVELSEVGGLHHRQERRAARRNSPFGRISASFPCRRRLGLKKKLPVDPCRGLIGRCGHPGITRRR